MTSYFEYDVAVSVYSPTSKFQASMFSSLGFIKNGVFYNGRHSLICIDIKLPFSNLMGHCMERPRFEFQKNLISGFREEDFLNFLTKSNMAAMSHDI